MSTTYVYNTGEYKTEDENLELVFGVFIDGTLNNKDNTDLRNKYSRGSASDPNYALSNSQIEKLEEADYNKVKNKSRIEKLLANKYRTTKEQQELDSISEKDKYLVASHRTWLDKKGTDNSFSNDYTNVARMWQYCQKDPYAIYVEGMGTDKENKDSQDGFAFGAGLTGIRARVREGCEKIAEKIVKEKDKKDNASKKLTKITFDVFGFSRGAAAARNFVNEIQLKSGYDKCKDFKIPDGYEIITNPTYSTHDREQRPVRKWRKAKVDLDEIEVDQTYLVDDKLPQIGHLGYSLLLNSNLTFKDLEGIEIFVRFIGIYDTVSSYYEKGGIGEYDRYGNLQDSGAIGKLASQAISSKFNSNVGPLKLNQLGTYQKIVHFTAKDEHRRNFALTRLPGANIRNQQGNIKTVERNFPGVHCDIGGAYMSEKEIVDEIGTNISDSGYKTKFWDYVAPITSLFHKTGLDALRQDLINEYWFNDKQLEINRQFGWIPPISSYKKLTGKRELQKEYSYIPLHFMEEYAKTTDMKKYFTDSLFLWFTLSPFLKNVKDYMRPYATGIHDDEWNFKTDDEIKKEREQIEKEEKFQNQLDNLLEKNSEFNILEKEKPVYDNLNPIYYLPKMDFNNLNIPENNVISENIDEEGEEQKTYGITEMEEVIVYADQQMLRRLRNEYLHWSSNRDWFGMEPNTNRIRKEF
jgi:hypothetical protein